MTRRERKERKLQKRLDWAESRDRKSSQESEASHKMAEHIPLGQPILIGHHSEKRHRNDLRKIQNHSTKAYDHSNMADYHREKADNLQHQLDNTIFSDDLDAVERLQEKIDTLEKQRNRMKEINKALKAGKEIELSEGEKKVLISNRQCWGDYKFMPYEFTNLSGRISQARKRLERLKKQR